MRVCVGRWGMGRKEGKREMREGKKKLGQGEVRNVSRDW